MKSSKVYLSGAGLPKLSRKKAIKRVGVVEMTSTSQHLQLLDEMLFLNFSRENFHPVKTAKSYKYHIFNGT